MTAAPPRRVAEKRLRFAARPHRFSVLVAFLRVSVSVASADKRPRKYHGSVNLTNSFRFSRLIKLFSRTLKFVSFGDVPSIPTNVIIFLLLFRFVVNSRLTEVRLIWMTAKNANRFLSFKVLLKKLKKFSSGYGSEAITCMSLADPARRNAPALAKKS